ncbi:MAG: ATP-grasp domain-containing protein [Candidatus Heimdallarchaeota archaeon]
MQPEERYLIIGFNSRPIAISAQYAGYRVAVIDFFGDLDLKISVDVMFSVLWQRAGYPLMRKLARPAQEYLMTLAEIMLEEQEVDGIIQGSGLDDYYKGWVSISKKCPLVGNPPKRLPLLRDRHVLYSLAPKFNLRAPQMEQVSSPKEACEIAQEVGFPVVLRPVGGSAGIDTYKCDDVEEVTAVAIHILKTRNHLLILDFIEGIPASVSLVGNGQECRVVAVNEQLIGIEAFGAPGKFMYAGNITPLALQLEPELIISLEQLGSKLKLVGSNGFDFVIHKDELFLMELNPRLQGTLEIIERAYNINLFELHLMAYHGNLPDSPPIPKRVTGKAVIYAKVAGSMSSIPQQLKKSQVVDRSLPDVILDRGDPVCTLLTSGKSREEVFSSLLEDSRCLFEVGDVESKKIKWNSSG